nr:E-beta-farnesene synthase [Tanacetum cinerariifolium]
MADVNAPSDQTPTMAPPVRPLQLPPTYPQYTSNSSGIRFYMTRKLDVTSVNWTNNGKKRATLIVIPSVRFTKLIIHHLQRKHRFHPRPDSSLHLSNEEPVLGYLKFSAKGTKRDIFGMPIPGRLIMANIRAAPYYQEYQENVAKHRGFLAGETRSTQDLPAPRPAKPARKPQSTAQKAPSKPSISSPASGTTDKPAKAKRIKHSISCNTRQSRGSPKSVGASEAKEVPAKEPQVAEEDADFLKAVEESMKDTYVLPKGQLPPVVIRESELGKYQPLPKVPGKGKAKVSEDEEESEKTGSDIGAQAEGQAVSNPDETSKGQAGSNPDETSEGQAGPDPGNAEARVQSTSSPMVHVGSDREHMDTDDTDVANVTLQPSTKQLYEGFTAAIYPNVQENLKLAVEEPVLLVEPASSSGTLSSLQHLSRDFTFGDQFLCDKPSDADKSAKTKVESMVNVPIQQAMSSISLMTLPIIDLTSRPESPKELLQLKATTTDTTTTTTTTLPPPHAPQQSMTEAMIVKRISELEYTLADLIQVNKTMEERLDKHRACLYTLEQLDIPQQVSIAVSEVVTDAVDWAMQALLRNCFRDLPKADMKEILHQRMWETDSYKSHKVHMQLFKAVEKSINCDQSEELAHDLAEARKKKKKSRESPKTPPGSPSNQPPPPPPPAGPSGTSRAPRAFKSQVTPLPPPPPTSTNQDSPSTSSAAPSPAKTVATTEHQAWLTPDVTLKPLVSLTPDDLDLDEAMGLDEQAQLSDEEDIRSAHIPTVNLRQGWWKPFEVERPTTQEYFGYLHLNYMWIHCHPCLYKKRITFL